MKNLENREYCGKGGQDELRDWWEKKEETPKEKEERVGNP